MYLANHPAAVIVLTEGCAQPHVLCKRKDAQIPVHVSQKRTEQLSCNHANECRL
jgi:hypothetical protein